MDSPDTTALLQAGLEALGLGERVPHHSARKLARYGSLLLEGNRVMNLTAITQPQEIATLHMLDSAALLCRRDLAGKSLVDVGTGAGFPGMVLKILCPTLELTLLDGLQKRLDWLGQVGQALELGELRILHGRAEEAGQDDALRERFDVATARAVAELRLLCELCLPLVKVGGQFLAMKGVECDRELDLARPAIETLGGRVGELFDYTIPGTAVTHRVVVVDKVAPTPAQYPRRFAKMQKKPL